MSDASYWLVHDHKDYEKALYECQLAVEQEDLREAKRRFDALRSELERHVEMEEKVLYPAYEAVAGAPHGPTEALREQHRELLRLLRDCSEVFATRDPEHISESLSTLDAAMTRHHDMEEEIFLPMAGHALLGSREEIQAKLDEFRKH